MVLDVVYNHLGNEGNYLRLFGPYFTDHHKTPWGEAINYDTDGCDHVRQFVIENALYWIREYHLDGLRLDAVQTIKDDSPRHLLEELQQNVQTLAQELGRKVCVVAETDENEPKYVRPFGSGYDLQGFWSDDFHHALHAFFTGERQGYYQDFGDPEQIVRALRDGYAFQGEFFKFWNAKRGKPAIDVQLPCNVICTQNHDQVGNRAKGDRLTTLVPRGVRYVTAAILLLAPHTPLLFMGQEYDESHPFQFFSDFRDPILQKAVSEGRRNEFKDFDFSEVPDPQDPATFERSRLDWSKVKDENPMLRWYRELIRLRKKHITPSRTHLQRRVPGWRAHPGCAGRYALVDFVCNASTQQRSPERRRRLEPDAAVQKRRRIQSTHLHALMWVPHPSRESERVVFEEVVFRLIFLKLESLHNLGNHGIDRLVDLDHQRVRRFFELLELALQQIAFCEVMWAGGDPLGNQLWRSPQIDQSRARCRELLPILLFERGTGDHEIFMFSVGPVHRRTNGGQPRRAVFIRERNTGAHLRLVGVGMKIVGVGKAPSETLR